MCLTQRYRNCECCKEEYAELYFYEYKFEIDRMLEEEMERVFEWSELFSELTYRWLMKGLKELFEQHTELKQNIKKILGFGCSMPGKKGYIISRKTGKKIEVRLTIYLESLRIKVNPIF